MTTPGKPPASAIFPTLLTVPNAFVVDTEPSIRLLTVCKGLRGHR